MTDDHARRAHRRPTPDGRATPASTPTSPRRHRAPAARSCSATTRSCGWRARELMADERFHRIEGQSLAEHRERVLGQLRLLAAEGDVHRVVPGAVRRRRRPRRLPGPVRGARRTPTRRCRSSPVCSGACSRSAIFHLGTERNHDEFLRRRAVDQGPGRVRDDRDRATARTSPAIGTTATYDPATQEFVIHTPFRAAWKDYLGNAGRARHGRGRVRAAGHARASTTACTRSTCRSATTTTMEFLPGRRRRGRRAQGRSERHRQRPALRFDHVRVPRTNLLNRYGDVDAGRHLLVADRQPRTPLLHDARHARAGPRLARRCRGRRRAALGLTIAITYGNQRRQFTPRRPTDEVVHPRLRRAPAPPAPAARRDVRRRASRTRTCSPRSTTCSPAATTPRRRARTSRRSPRRSSRRRPGTR